MPIKSWVLEKNKVQSNEKYEKSRDYLLLEDH